MGSIGSSLEEGRPFPFGAITGLVVTVTVATVIVVTNIADVMKIAVGANSSL